MTSQDNSNTELHTENVSSFLDLQSEFIRRRNDALTNRKTTEGIPITNLANKTKKNVLASTREEKQAKLEQSAQRKQRIRQNEELIRKEAEQQRKQREILEHKAAIYERMSRGEKLVYEDGKEAEFLVDFDVKKRQLDEKKRIKGLKQKCSQNDEDDSTDEELRRSDNEQESRQPAPLIVHYDSIEERGRVFGASHVPLPTLDEDAREKKIAELKSMTEQTNQERLKRKRQRNEEKAEERGRLNRLRERMGLAPVESSDDDDDEEKLAADEKPETSEPSMKKADTDKDATVAKKEEKPVKYGVREWDRGKVGYMRWIEGRREEREEEFAPPKFYNQ